MLDDYFSSTIDIFGPTPLIELWYIKTHHLDFVMLFFACSFDSWVITTYQIILCTFY